MACWIGTLDRTGMPIKRRWAGASALVLSWLR